MRIVFYVSGHGFGHASRDLEIIDAIAEAREGVQILVRSQTAPWLFRQARAAVEVEAIEADTGLVQLDSLHFDERATFERAAAFYGTFDQRVEAEARALRAARADLVVGDIPPLAFAAAARAGIASIAVGNFTWDWIYAEYPVFQTAPHVIAAIRAADATATRALRLPFHGGFDGMAAVEDIPLVARRSRRSRADTRRRLGVPDGRLLVLASFGAYGAPLPYDAIRASADFTLLTVDRHPPHGLTYPDLVAAADVVVSKPGYGIVSECIANGTALLYTSRGRFAEYDMFVGEMPRTLRCRFIPQDDLIAGRWSGAIAALVAQPPAPEPPRLDGAEVAAAAIVAAAS